MSKDWEHRTPVFWYSLLLFLISFSYNLLFLEVLKHRSEDEVLSRNIQERGRRGRIHFALSGVCVVVACFSSRLPYVLFFVMALLWILPKGKGFRDRRESKRR